MAGYEDFVYILGRGETKLDSFWGSFLCNFGSCLKLNVQNTEWG